MFFLENNSVETRRHMIPRRYAILLESWSLLLLWQLCNFFFKNAKKYTFFVILVFFRTHIKSCTGLKSTAYEHYDAKTNQIIIKYNLAKVPSLFFFK